MRAGQRVHAVHLHEAKAGQHILQIRALARTRAGAQQQVPVQKQPAGIAVRQQGAGHRRNLFVASVSLS
ncbi:hypothetical protein PDE01_13570 [Paracoccus denitrificans]|nr:hypothetical protein PDE01_13570 [Paracoccus denitrificans]